MRTYENYVIISPSYIIPSFQVRQGHPTTHFALSAIGASPKPQLERQKKMAIYHLSTKPISRSSGRSAVASVAYRAGIEIADERLGKTYDYTKRSGVLWVGMATPNGLEIDRNELWNRAEKTETRSNSRTAREIVINIPHELMQGDQSAGKMLAYEFATNLSQKYQIAVDVAVHAPDKQGDNRNYHAHLLLTTRQITQEQDGRFELGKKSQLEMSNTQLKQAGLLSNQDELKEIRRAWAELANTYLAEHGLNERIDHRSHKDRGLLTLPTVKMGWQATELERQGIRTEVGDQNRAIKAHNEQVLAYQTLKSTQSQEISNEQPTQTHQTQQSEVHPTPKVDTAGAGGIGRSQQTGGTILQSILSSQETNPNQRVISDTLKNAPRNAVEPQKNKNGVEVPSTPQNTLKTQNNANSNLLSSEQYRQTVEFLREFNDRLEQIAQNILENQLKTLRAKAKPILATFEKLRDNEPLFFGKDQWRKDKQQALNAYNAVKEQHDTAKANGVTADHRKQANEQLAKDDPDYYERGKQAKFEIIWQILDERDEKAKQYGADEQAKPSQTYNGKIIKSNDTISLQETQKGIILHRIGGLEVGKVYTLVLDLSENYSIKKDYEYEQQKTQDYPKLKQVSRNDDRGR